MNTAAKLRVRVLAVLPDQRDRASLQEIFRHSNWSLDLVDNYQDAERALATARFGVVITDADLGADRDWKYILDETLAMAVPVPVIVTDRLADERLWAEVLNLRAYDLLLKPFDSTEVYRIVSSAWLFCCNQYQASTQRKPMQTSTSQSPDDSARAIGCQCGGSL
jgi:DNA-binding NtrC family response regulator